MVLPKKALAKKTNFQHKNHFSLKQPALLWSPLSTHRNFIAFSSVYFRELHAYFLRWRKLSQYILLHWANSSFFSPIVLPFLPIYLEFEVSFSIGVLQKFCFSFLRLFFKKLFNWNFPQNWLFSSEKFTWHQSDPF